MLMLPKNAHCGYFFCTFELRCALNECFDTEGGRLEGLAVIGGLR